MKNMKYSESFQHENVFGDILLRTNFFI